MSRLDRLSSQTPDSVVAGLKDNTRAARRRVKGVLGEDGCIARVEINFGRPELVATRRIPTGTAVKLGLEERRVPRGDGTEEVEPIKRSSRVGPKPKRALLQKEAEREAAEYPSGEPAVAATSDLFEKGSSNPQTSATEEERTVYSSGDATEEVDATGVVQGLACPISNPWEYCAAGSIKAVGSRALETGFSLTPDEREMLRDQGSHYAATAEDLRQPVE